VNLVRTGTSSTQSDGCVDLPESHDDSYGQVVVAVHEEALVRAITERTVAILVVHVFGMIGATDSQMQLIRQQANRAKRATATIARPILVLEDCAECFTGLAKGSYLGSSHADASLFSFGTIKTLTALGGGVAIVQPRCLLSRSVVGSIEIPISVGASWSR
jgi:dTDP-4-amino-4,6-dideoxygalactose transaminase